MMIEPAFNFLLIEKDEEKKETNSGIMLPEEYRERPSTGNVIARGKGLYNDKGELIPMITSVGDKVLFPRGVPIETELDGNKYYLIRESDIMGIIK